MGFGKYLVLILFVWIHRVHCTNVSEYPHKLCDFTRYPQHCAETLSTLNSEHQNGDIVYSLVGKLKNATMELTAGYLSTSLKGEHAQSSSIGYCVELLNMSLRRLDQSLLALKDSPRRRKLDIQTWLSAVITFQSSCKDVLHGHPEKLLGTTSKRMGDLSRLASNTLALVNRISGKGIDTSENHFSSGGKFPDWLTQKTRKLLQTTSIKANAVVAKDGSGNYRTVSEAIEAASGGRFVIYVKAGVYKEKIYTNKDGITLIGAGKSSTIIAYDDSMKGGTEMHKSASFTITGDGFIARDIGFQNTAGPSGGQAVAMNIASDHSVLYRCSIAGYQDTLYALALRQFYRECDIYGTIDFIFRNAAAVFQNCYLVLRRPQSGAYNVMLANGREDPGQNTGFSIQRCTIAAGSDLSPVKNSVGSYLGRPWKKYARTVIMQSIIDNAIKPRGYIEWDDDLYLSTLYFAEFANSGPGASTSKRVTWPGFHVIGASEAEKFTVDKLIGGSAWLPSTGIKFDTGL